MRDSDPRQAFTGQPRPARPLPSDDPRVAEQPSYSQRFDPAFADPQVADPQAVDPRAVDPRAVYPQAAHPLHALLVVASAALFLGALVADNAYAQSYQIQWSNLASWLIAGALVPAGIALLFAVVDLFRARRRAAGSVPHAVVLLAAFGLGLVNAFVHAQDAWAKMPTALVLSVVVTALSAIACWYALRRGPVATRAAHGAMRAPHDATTPSAHHGAHRGPHRGAVAAVVLLGGAAMLMATLRDADSAPEGRGAGVKSEDLPAPKRGLMPSMTIAQPEPWGDRKPTVPAGYRIDAIATDLRIPRQTLLLPNGDILVAEGRGGSAPALTPKDVIAGIIKSRGTTQVKSGDRLTLLRDADGDGVYETKQTWADELDAPYGMALVGDALYVANQDELVRFDYKEGATKAGAAPVKVADLPSAINHHWTKALVASRDGRHLYVGIGSNSNITERGMSAEVDRAMIWQVDAKTGARRPFATGLRNPTALAIQPGTDRLWAVVNERDELGENLVPDYLSSVKEGGFYGWPYSYWGSIVDERVRPQAPAKVASAIVPDYSLGAHVAALGVAFSNEAMGGQFGDGVFVGEHGSWNRSDPVGYRVVFVPFRDGKPSGPPIDFVAGFRDDDGKTRGRPVGVTVDPRGALIVADDLSNTVWRVTPPKEKVAQRD